MSGEERFPGARALVIGAGPLGAVAATHLVAAGVGQVGVVDGGAVEPADLHGSAVYLAPDVGQPRADIAAVKLGLLNPEVLIEPYPVPLEGANAEAIVLGADVVLDCSGKADTRLKVNDACCAQGVPLVVGLAGEQEGTVMAIRPGESACWRCAASQAPAGDSGAVGALYGVVGSMQALAALQMLAGQDGSAHGHLIRIDGRTLAQTVVPVERQLDCTACAELAAAPHLEH